MLGDFKVTMNSKLTCFF